MLRSEGKRGADTLPLGALMLKEKCRNKRISSSEGLSTISGGWCYSDQSPGGRFSRSSLDPISRLLIVLAQLWYSTGKRSVMEVTRRVSSIDPQPVVTGPKIHLLCPVL